MHYIHLHELNTDMLQEAYQQAVNGFKSSLLSGRPWEEVQELRLEVSILSTALYERLQQPEKHPAGHGNRNSR